MIDPGLAVPKGLEKGLLSKLHMTRKWRNESEKIVTGVKAEKKTTKEIQDTRFTVATTYFMHEKQP